MRTQIRKSVVVFSAALAMSLGIFAGATPAAAHSWPHHGFHSGFFAGAIGFGLLGGMAASQYADDSCIQHHPTYDRWGNYIGSRDVDVCD